MKLTSKSLTLALLSAASLTAQASTISTTFARSEGFTSRDTDDVVLTNSIDGFAVTFSGGVQEQSFDGPAYAAGPDAYFFVSAGMGTFTGSFGVRPLASTGDTGTVSFNRGVTDLSFNAANRANGTPSFQILDLNGNLLSSSSITETSNRAVASGFSFNSEDLGGLIGSVVFDNAGPAGNPPYVIAIDRFSATAVPEPSSVLMCCIGLAATLRRRR